MRVAPSPESQELIWDEDEWLNESRTRVANDVDWRDRLRLSKPDKETGRQSTLPSLANASTILKYHEDWRDVLAYDEFGDCVLKMKPPPWDPADAPANPRELSGEWSDDDSTRCKLWLERKEGIQVAAENVDKAVAAVAKTKSFHPVKDYLAAIKWDTKPRIHKLLSAYCGAEESEYTSAIGKRWMISAIARIMEPGCQVDCAIILEGAQGIGKSTGVRRLVGKWYSDTGINIGDKDSYQSLRNAWVYGLDELDSLKRSEITKTKTFISSQVDRYRPSFGRRARDFPRQCVFVGSTNESEYLADTTGNRRFWPVKVVKKIDVAAIERDRDQLWAEALVCYRGKQPWHVDTEELRKLCEEQQAERVQADPWEEVVSAWLTCPRHGETCRPFEVDERGVLVYDILVHAIGKKPEHITKFDQMRISQVLRTLGYERGPQKREHGRLVRRFLKCNQ